MSAYTNSNRKHDKQSGQTISSIMLNWILKFPVLWVVATERDRSKLQQSRQCPSSYGSACLSFSHSIVYWFSKRINLVIERLPWADTVPGTRDKINTEWIQECLRVKWRLGFASNNPRSGGGAVGKTEERETRLTVSWQLLKLGAGYGSSLCYSLYFSMCLNFPLKMWWVKRTAKTLASLFSALRALCALHPHGTLSQHC